MERSNVSVVALAWFRREEWNELKRICPDLHDTYEEWLADAQAGIEALGSPLKDQVVKVILTVDELRKWKRATGREIDGKVRARLAVKGANQTNSTRH
ncbi:hypothetical protein [Bradyrhizobium sp. AZCC 2289]|uniref:hypothetical protein n=1 Tax=Bradyrhizobium sp. AZCC 2289 TaxID=3117026 RepID=UPI002FF0C226